MLWGKNKLAPFITGQKGRNGVAYEYNLGWFLSFWVMLKATHLAPLRIHNTVIPHPHYTFKESSLLTWGCYFLQQVQT